LDSALQATKAIPWEKENLWIYSQWNSKSK